MRVGFCLVKSGEVSYYINPLLVRYFEQHGADQTNIVFNEEHSLKVKASSVEVEKMLTLK